MFSHDYSSVSSHLERLTHQSDSRLSRDRLNESRDVALVLTRKEGWISKHRHERHESSS